MEPTFAPSMLQILDVRTPTGMLLASANLSERRGLLRLGRDWGSVINHSDPGAPEESEFVEIRLVCQPEGNEGLYLRKEDAKKARENVGGEWILSIAVNVVFNKEGKARVLLRFPHP